jgi:SAM-dependent methyltransferase
MKSGYNAPTMDPATVQHYDDQAEFFFALYSSIKDGIEKYFKLAFPAGSEVLDIGAGSGRAVDILIREGYQAYGVEPSPRLRSLATSRIPGLEGRIQGGAIPGLASALDRKFDGILCSGVFQHIPQKEQTAAAEDIRKLLKPCGRLLITVPKDRPGIDESGRDEHQRLYTQQTPQALESLFESLGFQGIGKWEDADNLGRPGFSWTTFLFSI